MDEAGGWTILVGHRVVGSAAPRVDDAVTIPQSALPVVRRGAGRPLGSRNKTRPVDRRRIKGPIGLGAIGDLIREGNPTSAEQAANDNPRE